VFNNNYTEKQIMKCAYDKDRECDSTCVAYEAGCCKRGGFTVHISYRRTVPQESKGERL